MFRDRSSFKINAKNGDIPREVAKMDLLRVLRVIK